MSKTDNTFVYWDLNTTDKEAAAKFYGKVFGWEVEHHDKSGTHSSFKNNGQGFGGLDVARGGAPAHWMGYVAVNDADERMKRLEQLGGKPLMPNFDIPEVGRIGVLQDPNGATFALYQGQEHMGEWEPDRDSTGNIGWAEITATDVDKAKGFYGEGFGWKVGRTMEMPDGAYHMLMKGEQAIGGLYKKPPMMPVNAWLFYVNVDDADATAAKVKEHGGQVLVLETVPDMVRFGLMQDPQGAVIGFAKSLA